MGARFCHVCGTTRTLRPSSVRDQVTRVLDTLDHLREAVKLPAASLLALALGIVCLIAAIATGFLFSAATLSDWQAVQFWRTQWLLAAVAAFLAGILLKR